MKIADDKFIKVPDAERAGRLKEPRIRVERLTEFTPEVGDLLQEYYLAVNVVQRDELGALKRIVDDVMSGVWLAFTESEAVGCVVLRRLELLPNSGECKRLYVKPSARGKHIATSLLDAQESYALKQGLEWIYLDSSDELNAAIAFYNGRGYQQCARYNDNPQATVFMRKRISECAEHGSSA